MKKHIFGNRIRRTVLCFLGLGISALLFQNFIFPEAPSHNIDVKTIQMRNGKYIPTNNHLPLSDYTQDGRIGMRWKPGKNGGPVLFLTRPENVKDHLFSKSNPIMGANLIHADTFDTELDFDGAHKAYKTQIGPNLHFEGKNILCEKTEDFQNPTICRPGRDCYTVTIVVRYFEELPGTRHYRLVSNDVLIEVENPKTSQARIARAEVLPSSTRIGPSIYVPIVAEPTIAGDGRLLVARLGNTDLRLSDGKTVKHNIDVGYAVYGRNQKQCDVTRWTQFHPISHAHYDTKNNMKGRYKFARYPIRDSLGNIVPNGEEFGASYPWIDRHAANLFFTTHGKNPFYTFDKNINKIITPFPERVGATDPRADYFNLQDVKTSDDYLDVRELVEESGNVAGFSVAGFWTHGKVVLLDGLLNNVDFLFRVSDRQVDRDLKVDKRNGQYRISTARDLKLYQGNSFERVGGVREGGSGLLPYQENLNPNTTFMGSIENRLNYNKNMMPVTPRDVVWHFGSSRHTEELPFDDYNSPFVLINAEMTAALEIGAAWNSVRTMRHLTGYWMGIESPQVVGFPRKIIKNLPALIQNSGTAPDSFMTLPYYGKIDTRYSRIEPIAKGGIFGKGLWLEDRGSLHFQIPPQVRNPDFSIEKNRNWYVGTFVDGRGQYSARHVADFISLGELQIRLSKSSSNVMLFDRVLFVKNGKYIGEASLPGMWNGIWGHIGISFSGDEAPEVFYNGFSMGRVQPLGAFKVADLRGLMELKPGDNIHLGKNPQSPLRGIKGWFDDFKVIARTPTYEESCNYARGTLVALGASDDAPTWQRIASRYPVSSHVALAKAISDQNLKRKFACFVNYYYQRDAKDVLYNEDHSHLRNLPENSRSIREEVLMTKNMLVYGQSRPDFTKNQFCLSCHTSAQPFNEMNLTALKEIPGLSMQADPRRQPMQPDRYLRGHIPANYFGPGMPANTIAAKETDVDRFLHPRRDSIRVRWTQLGREYQYQLEIRDSSSGTPRTLAPCVSATILKNENSYRLDGTCGSAGSQRFPLNHKVEIRVCHSSNGKFDGANAKCSGFVPLNTHTDGDLRIFIRR